MNDTIVFVDNGFFKLVKKNFENNSRVKKKLLKTFKNICKNENLKLEHLFFYAAPPYQSANPTKIEMKLKSGYDNLSKLFSYKKWITLREGRCQRLKMDGNFKYSQKGVDILIAMDLMEVEKKYPNIKKIILIACDSDFVPVINNLRKNGIEVILYTYFDRVRGSLFSKYNELLNCCSRWVKFKSEDFD